MSISAASSSVRFSPSFDMPEMRSSFVSSPFLPVSNRSNESPKASINCGSAIFSCIAVAKDKKSTSPEELNCRSMYCRSSSPKAWPKDSLRIWPREAVSITPEPEVSNK